MFTIHEGRFGLQLDPARITHVEDIYDADWTRYARVHFKSFRLLDVPPCDVPDADGDVFDALVKAGCKAA